MRTVIPGYGKILYKESQGRFLKKFRMLSRRYEQGGVWIFKSESLRSGKSMPSIMFQNFWKCTEKVRTGCPHLFSVVVCESISPNSIRELQGYLKRRKPYAHHINLWRRRGNSYSKRISATFYAVKRDYMGNDQLLPAYNLRQRSVMDIAVVDVKPYASDMECFVPLDGDKSIKLMDVIKVSGCRCRVWFLQ